MQNSRYLFLLLFVIALLLLASPLIAQSYASSHAEHELKKIRLALNLGHAYIPGASFEIVDDFVTIPVWGIDCQYWFNPKWELALKNDIQIAKYTINNRNDHSDTLVRKNRFIVTLPVLFILWDNGLTFMLVPGIELEGHQNFSVFRFGIDYEFEIGKHRDFDPEIGYDLKNGHINFLTRAIGAGKIFN